MSIPSGKIFNFAFQYTLVVKKSYNFPNIGGKGGKKIVKYF